uniref:Uncharacterized protein n=1 Tax=Klebsiella pneumoniae TaxID=573 RepID=A0A6G9HPL9_KLEPN|nr:hypothetical protein [Klebsiella pneumoniae]
MTEESQEYVLDIGWEVHGSNLNITGNDEDFSEVFSKAKSQQETQMRQL